MHWSYCNLALSHWYGSILWMGANWVWLIKVWLKKTSAWKQSKLQSIEYGCQIMVYLDWLGGSCPDVKTLSNSTLVLLSSERDKDYEINSQQITDNNKTPPTGFLKKEILVQELTYHLSDSWIPRNSGCNQGVPQTFSTQAQRCGGKQFYPEKEETHMK